MNREMSIPRSALPVMMTALVSVTFALSCGGAGTPSFPATPPEQDTHELDTCERILRKACDTRTACDARPDASCGAIREQCEAVESISYERVDACLAAWESLQCNPDREVDVPTECKSVIRFSRTLLCFGAALSSCAWMTFTPNNH